MVACCARVVTGHAAAAPPTSAMNSRRLMCCPQYEDHTLPHRGKAVLRITAFWPTQLPLRVISDRSDPAAGPRTSGYYPKAEVKSGYWHLRRWAFAGSAGP